MNKYTEILSKLEPVVIDLWKNNHFSRESQNKGKLDIVTETDLKFEEVILNTLNKIAPEIPILSEETLSNTKEEGTFFTVDPVDGTWNYANNVPIYGTQISMLEKNKPVLGLIYLPAFDQMYSAYKGGGSFLNGKLFKTEVKDINKAEVSISDLRRGNDQTLNLMITLARNMASDFGKTRMVGASCFDYSMVARGNYQAKISLNPHLWDVAPGQIIIEEAGGVTEYNKHFAIAATCLSILDVVKIDYYAALEQLN